MPVTAPVKGIGWLSGRAVALHLALVAALPMCAGAAWWQVTRALSGNLLSWLYVVEWPAFAAIAVWLWWVLLTTRPRRAAVSEPPDEAGALLTARAAPLRWDAEQESEPLRDYNSYLAELNSGRRVARPGQVGRGHGRRPPLRRRSAPVEAEVSES